MNDIMNAYNDNLEETQNNLEELQARHTALVEAVDKYIQSDGTVYDLEELAVALATAQEEA